MERDPVGHRVWVGENVGGRHPDHRDAKLFEPMVAALIGGDTVVVLAAVDFDAQLRRRTVEVEYVRADGMLLAKAQAALLAADRGPQQPLGLGRIAAEPARAIERGFVAAVAHGPKCPLRQPAADTSLRRHSNDTKTHR